MRSAAAPALPLTLTRRPHPPRSAGAADALQRIIVEGAKHALREGPAHLSFLEVSRQGGAAREGVASIWMQIVRERWEGSAHAG